MHRWRPFPRGMDNPKGKLDEPTKEAMRQERAAGASYRAIAREHEVSPAAVHKALKNRAQQR